MLCTKIGKAVNKLKKDTFNTQNITKDYNFSVKDVSQDVNEDVNEDVDQDVNKIINEGLNTIVLKSNDMNEKERSIIIKEMDLFYSNNDNYSKTFNILLKKTENTNIFPYGSEIILKHEIGLQNLTKSNIFYLSAKFTPHNLIAHQKNNQEYSSFISNKPIQTHKHLSKSNFRKIDTLFLLLNKNELFQESVNKDFYQSYWDNFVKRFYFIFSKKKNK